jgi:hypothetical protein
MSLPTMGSPTNRFEFVVRQMGCVATGALKCRHSGRVSAVFDTSFYVELETGMVCIGTGNVGASPLNLVTTAPETINWPDSGLRLNAKVGIDKERIRIGNQFSFLTKNAVEWSPGSAPTKWSREGLATGVAALRAVCGGFVPEEGLGGFILPERRPFKRQSICGMAETPVAGLCRWLEVSLREFDQLILKDLRWVHPLSGLGPGLTPSGDDFLGGMMIALRYLKHEKLSNHLWRPVRQCAIDTGNSISLAHLTAASQGLGHGAIHTSLAAILVGDRKRIAASASAIDSVGHTSGWDILAGATTVFETWLMVDQDDHLIPSCTV